MDRPVFALKIEWQKNASGKVTCDAKSGKLGAHQVEGAGGWHQVLGRGAISAARVDVVDLGRMTNDKGIFIVLGSQNLG